MNSELTISRVGALAGFTKAPLHNKDRKIVLEAFRKQLEAMLHGNNAFDEANAAIIAEAPNSRCVKISRDNADDKIETYRILSDEIRSGQPAWTWVGILPSTKMKVVVESADAQARTDWIIRARCSVTACALHESERQSKIWITFEGVPANADPLDRPTEQNVADFVALTDRMEKASMKLFHDAAGAALKKTRPEINLGRYRLSEPRIRVRMTDTTDPSVSDFLDVMFSGARTLTEIREGGTPTLMRAQKGLRAFENLLREVGGHKITHPLLHAAEGPLGSKGAVYRTIDRKTKDTIVIGVGLQIGTVKGQEDLSPEKRAFDMKESHIRKASAVRPLSANVAQAEAIKLERRLKNV